MLWKWTLFRKGRETFQVSVKQELPANTHLDTNGLLVYCHFYPSSANNFEKVSFSFLHLTSTYLGVCARLLCWWRSQVSTLASPLPFPSQQISPASGCRRGVAWDLQEPALAQGSLLLVPLSFDKGLQALPVCVMKYKSSECSLRMEELEKGLQVGSRVATTELLGHKDKPAGGEFVSCLRHSGGPSHHQCICRSPTGD